MPDKGKKRVAQWCTFCEMEGHTQEECHRWAACLRDTAMANNISMMAAYKPSQNQKTNPHKKTHRSYRGGQNRTARNNLPPPPSPSIQSVGTITATRGSPSVEPDLLSILVQVSRSESELLLRFLEKIRGEGSADFVENLLIGDEPKQEETTQGPYKESGSDDEVKKES